MIRPSPPREVGASTATTYEAQLTSAQTQTMFAAALALKPFVNPTTGNMLAVMGL